MIGVDTPQSTRKGDVRVTLRSGGLRPILAVTITQSGPNQDQRTSSCILVSYDGVPINIYLTTVVPFIKETPLSGSKGPDFFFSSWRLPFKPMLVLMSETPLYSCFLKLLETPKGL